MNATEMQEHRDLVCVENLHVWFGRDGRPVRSVDGVSLRIPIASTIGLVGESGCGKTVTALSLARLIPPSEMVRCSGSILFDGDDVLSMDRRRLFDLRGGEIAYIFQEPSVALNPVLTVGYQIMEAVREHRPDASAKDEAVELLRLVGIGAPEARLRSYPHELSGGMQQRVMIAMALACRPKLLIADEPTTALDVTIQAQILELLVSLCDELGMALLLITHNLGLVAETAQQVHVMYAGRIVESGATVEVLGHPAHPYTRGLLRAVPTMGSADRQLQGIEGAVPHPAELPDGCKFAPRCSMCEEVCVAGEPDLMGYEGAADGHVARCHFAGEQAS